MGRQSVLWLQFIGFAIGIVMLLGGAELVVRGGGGLAKRLGVPPLFIGLTIVALGTSAPELVVSATASKFGDGHIALGNVLGSNILNILIVLGITALVRPLPVRKGILEQDLPLMLLITAVLWLTGSEGGFGALEATILLLFIPVYILRLYQREIQMGDLEAQVSHDLERPMGPFWAVAAIAGGIALLVYGGRWVVDSGIIIADAWGIPERVVAVTLVAFGTSAPELATSLMAALRGKTDLAVGNAVGSNFLNLYMVLGASAAINPLPMERGALLLDFPVAILGVGLLWYLSRKGNISAKSGGLLVSIYVIYAILLFSGVAD